MNGELRLITPTQMLDLIHLGDRETAIMLEAALASDPLMAGTWGAETVCLFGFVPQGIGAYLWMYKTSQVACHRVAYGRWARRVIRMAKLRYPVIRGHTNSESLRWLEFLGAKVVGTTHGAIEFEIGTGDG